MSDHDLMNEGPDYYEADDYRHEEPLTEAELEDYRGDVAYHALADEGHDFRNPGSCTCPSCRRDREEEAFWASHEETDE